MAKKVLTHNLAEPLGGATTATIEIDAGTGNLAIDRLAGSEQVLVNGWCQQFPSHSIGTLLFGRDGYLYISFGDGGGVQ